MNLLKNKNIIKQIALNISGIILGIVLVLSVYMLISYQNINYQAKATIDYVYAVKTGGSPELADTWLGEKYCRNNVALNIGYPEYKDKCNVILADKKLDFDKAKKDEQN